MRILINQFCFLATAPTWIAWLYEFSPALYTDLVEHLRKKPSCRANGEKMLQILKTLQVLPHGEEGLESFLRRTFPHVLVDDNPQSIKIKPKVQGPVFEHYDPNLLTVPRRHVLSAAQHPDLESAIWAFVADMAESDYVIVDGVAYIEYLPPGLAHLVGIIPTKNWLVRCYRQSNQQ